MNPVRSEIDVVATSHATVLLTGATGTGKELAFTDAVRAKPGKFGLAPRGTLFLDAIGALPLDAQATLLRVLEDGQVERVGSTRPIAVAVHRRRDERADTDRQAILRALESSGWRISGAHGAAHAIGITPTTRHSKIRRLGIQRPRHEVVGAADAEPADA